MCTADLSVYEPYEISNIIKCEIEKQVTLKNPDLDEYEAEDLAAREVPDFIEFLVKLYFNHKSVFSS